MTRLFALAPLLLVSAAAIADYEEDWGYGFVDVDRDAQVTEDEFDVALDAMDPVGAWDLNGDDFIDEREWEEAGLNGEFDEWDLDADRQLDDNEVRTGLFVSFDADEDKLITQEEWAEADEEGWFDW